MYERRWSCNERSVKASSFGTDLYFCDPRERDTHREECKKKNAILCDRKHIVSDMSQSRRVISQLPEIASGEADLKRTFAAESRDQIWALVTTHDGTVVEYRGERDRPLFRHPTDRRQVSDILRQREREGFADLNVASEFRGTRRSSRRKKSASGKRNHRRRSTGKHRRSRRSK